jgi:hypothetical protein
MPGEKRDEYKEKADVRINPKAKLRGKVRIVYGADGTDEGNGDEPIGDRAPRPNPNFPGIGALALDMPKGDDWVEVTPTRIMLDKHDPATLRSPEFSKS